MRILGGSGAEEGFLLRLLEELKRRGVLQMAVAYTVAAWLVIQVSDILVPTFGAPDWAMRLIVLLLMVGFPITLALAWLYRVTAEGVQPESAAVAGDEQPAFPGQRLNYIIIGILAAAVVLFALDKFLWQTELSLPSSGGQQSIAVLPFRNLSGDPDTEPFVNGIHDDLLTQLSRIGALRTISRTSVMQYRDTELPIPRIAEELDVTAVLEGGVQRSEDRIRVNAQLIDGRNDAHLWAETFDRQLTAANIFAIQSEIARAIASALRAELSGEEKRALEAVPTTNLAAYDAYTAARASMDGMADNEYARALELFMLATELDPEFAAPWAGLCLTHLGMYSRDSVRSHFDQAEAACERALELDDSRAEVYVALGTLYRFFGQYSKAEVVLQQANFAKAEEALEQALALDSTEVDALVELGRVLANQGRLKEAEELLLRAETLEPRSWYAQNSLFSFYYTFSDRPDRFDRAARHAAKSASLRPDLAASWNNIGAANYMMGRYDLAADAWKESLEIEPNRTGYTNTGLALYYSGEYAEAVRMQEKAIALSPEDHRAMGRLADALRQQGGQSERATQAYRQAADLAQALLEVNDRDWRTLGQLAFYQAHLQEAEAAQDSLGRALQLSERNAETLYYQALIHTIEGRGSAAVDSLAEALGKDPEYRNLVSIDPDFQSLRNLPAFRTLVGTS